MNTRVEISKKEPCTSDRLRMIARMSKIKYRPDESDEAIRERVIEELSRRKDDKRYEKIRGYINLSLMHVAGGGGFEYEIRQ